MTTKHLFLPALCLVASLMASFTIPRKNNELAVLAQQAITAQYGEKLKEMDRSNEYFFVTTIFFSKAIEKEVAGQKQKIIQVKYQLKYVKDWYKPGWITGQYAPLHKAGDEVPAQAEVVFAVTDEGRWEVISVDIKKGLGGINLSGHENIDGACLHTRTPRALRSNLFAKN